MKKIIMLELRRIFRLIFNIPSARAFYSHIIYTRDDLCQIIRDYFQSFGKGYRIIRGAEFLEEVWYTIVALQ